MIITFKIIQNINKINTIFLTVTYHEQQFIVDTYSLLKQILIYLNNNLIDIICFDILICYIFVLIAMFIYMLWSSLSWRNKKHLSILAETYVYLLGHYISEKNPLYKSDYDA